MKKLGYILICAATLLPFVGRAATSVSPATQAELKKYCVENKANVPKEMQYTPDGLTFLQLSDDGKFITRYDTRSGAKVETVLDVSKTRYNQMKSADGFVLSEDGTKILVYENVQKIYRHSFAATYYVFEIKRNILKPLSTEHPMQQCPVFSPDSRMVAFMADNNIYIKKLDYETEVPVTKDGKINHVINGVQDYVYQEEFGGISSMVWSPDNTMLCFLKYDESQVPEYSLTLYEGACNPQSQYALYPGKFTYKYPVAGEKTAKVTVHSYDVETRKVKNIALPDANIEYIPHITYAGSPNRLAVVTLNRAQNHLEIYAVNPRSTVVKSLYVDENKTGWIEPSAWTMARWYADFFVIASERSGRNQMFQYNYSGALMRKVTGGVNEVTDYYGYDAKNRTHYYQSTNGPLNRVVNMVDMKGQVKVISQPKGTSDAVFDPSMSFYVLGHSSTAQVPVYGLYTLSGKKLRVVEDNRAYASRYASVPKKEFFTLQSDGQELNGYMIKPNDFDASRRYPVIMYQYSGPGAQLVLDKWGIDWMQFFATQGYIVVCVDGRGTGGRGREFKNSVYLHLGKYETIDQLNAAKYVASLSYVDAERIGIFGWSYGGYETLIAVSQVGSPYAAAVAVAPVTSWKYYDCIYTERFMLTPRENEDGYMNGAPINLVKNVKCPLLIMTGTADDNVHPANTIEYISHLLAAGNTCDMLPFPNMNHSINTCNGRLMVYTKMLDYFNKNLKQK